jgi:hypothetical protein
MRGDDFAIVELNGASSESTNIYDPSRSLFQAYRTLFRQWALVFRIGPPTVREDTSRPPSRGWRGSLSNTWRAVRPCPCRIDSASATKPSWIGFAGSRYPP